MHHCHKKLIFDYTSPKNKLIMKQTLLFITSVLFLATSLHGQLILTSADYFPAVGDTLRTAVDNAPVGIVLTAPGGNQSWNFSSLQSGFTQERIVRDPAEGEVSGSYPGATALLEQAGGGEGYYVGNSTSFAIVGYAGTDPLMQGLQINAPFDPPYVERWAPLAFFDLRNHQSALTLAVATQDIPGNLFGNLPITPDSIRVRVNTTRTDLVDGWGTLTIPGGVYDVLREKRTEYREVRLDAKVGSFPWTDITDLALAALPIDQLGVDTLVTYSFWSDEAKEPIAVITTNSMGNEVVSVEYKSNNIVNSVRELNRAQPRVYVYPNPALIYARFEFTNLPAGNYYLELYNLVGRPVWSKQYYIDGYLLDKVNVMQLQKGIYIYVLRDEKGNRILANRLLVTTP